MKVANTLTKKSRPESGLDSLECAEFARQRNGIWEMNSTLGEEYYMDTSLIRKRPPPLGLPWDPRPRPTVKSEQGAFSSKVRYPCTQAIGRNAG